MLCHQPQNADPTSGNSLDLKVMAHKIHMGSQLPSVVGTSDQARRPYEISGYMNSISNFSTVIDPADPAALRSLPQPDHRRRAGQSIHDGAHAGRPAALATTTSISPLVSHGPEPNHPGGLQARRHASAPTATSRKARCRSTPPSWARTWCPRDTAAIYPQNPDTLIAGMQPRYHRRDQYLGRPNAHRHLHLAGQQWQQHPAVAGLHLAIHHGRSDHRLRATPLSEPPPALRVM